MKDIDRSEGNIRLAEFLITLMMENDEYAEACLQHLEVLQAKML